MASAADRPIRIPVRPRRDCRESGGAAFGAIVRGPSASNQHRSSSPLPVSPADAAPDRDAWYEQLQSPLFGKLPAELRLIVWEFVLTPQPDIDRPTVAVGLLETCRKIYDETNILLYKLNHIRARLSESPLPRRRGPHWSRSFSAAQQAVAHLHLYVQPGCQAWGWNLLNWTKHLGFHPATLQLTIWFTSGIGWWSFYVRQIFQSLSVLSGMTTCILEFRTQRDRFPEFDKHIQTLYKNEILLSDGRVLEWDGEQPEYREGSQVAMTDKTRTARLRNQPRWLPCEPEQPGRREMLAIILRWQLREAG